MRIERVSNNVSDKLRALSGAPSWSDMILRSRRFYRIDVRAEEIDYYRAEVFISDINKKTRGAFSDMNMEHLVHILYTDFLQQIRENLNEVQVRANAVTMENVVSELVKKRNKYFPRYHKSNPDGDFLSSPRKNWAILQIYLRKEAAQRGEVFLYDANVIYPEFIMELDELLSILFVDFVSQLRRGNQSQLLQALLDRFYSHDFE